MGNRRTHDYYPTLDSFVNDSLSLLPTAFAPTRVLDPGAGCGAWGRIARARWELASIDGVEVRNVAAPPGYQRWYYQDYLTFRPSEHYDLVIGNPPYTLAEPFIRHSLDLLQTGGYLVQLLRLAFLESQRRIPFWRDYPAQRVGVFSFRPSFTGDGKTAQTAYAAFLWQKGWYGTSTLCWPHISR